MKSEMDSGSISAVSHSAGVHGALVGTTTNRRRGKSARYEREGGEGTREALLGGASPHKVRGVTASRETTTKGRENIDK